MAKKAAGKRKSSPKKIARARRAEPKAKAPKRARKPRDISNDVIKMRGGIKVSTSNPDKVFDKVKENVSKIINGVEEKPAKVTRKKREASVDTSLLSGTFEKRLRVRLTLGEIEQKHRRTTEIHQLIRVQEAKAKEATKDMREEIRKLKGEEDDLQDQLAAGAEERAVECQNRKDYRNDVVETIRLDSSVHWTDEVEAGGVVESRKMTMGERQQQFPGTELPAGGRSAAKKARAARALAAVPKELQKVRESSDPSHRTCSCGDTEEEHGGDKEFPGATACRIEGCDCVAFEYDPEKTTEMQKASDRVRELESGKLDEDEETSRELDA